MGGLLDYQGIYAVFEPWILSFGLALVRIGTLFITTPVFSMSMIPNTIKAAMVALLTLVAMSNVQPIPYITQLNAIEIGGAILTEACVGGVMGISVMFLFGALAMAGQLIGIQMGFAIANVVDPTTNQQNGVLAQLLNLMGLSLFIALDGHLYMLQALFQSFSIVPLGGATPQGANLMTALIIQGSQLFSIGLRIGLPVVCVVLLVNVGLATLARTVPQVNIFVVGFMITISLGLLILGIAFPSIASVFKSLMQTTIQDAARMLRFF